MVGWLKLNRNLFDSEIWLHEKKFNHGQAWIDLLLMASFEERTVYVRGIEINLSAGDLFWSIEKLGERWNWNPRTVKKFLGYLSNKSMIQCEIKFRLTKISIINWSKYQIESEDYPVISAGQEICQNKDVKTQKVQNRFNNTGLGKSDVLMGTVQDRIQNKVQNKVQANKEIKEIKELYNNIPKKIKALFLETSTEYQLSKLLYEKIKKNDENFKAPDFQKWTAEIEKISRLDKRDFEEIERVILFSQDSEFWKSNILSPSKLRIKFTTLLLQSKNKGNKSNANNRKFDSKYNQATGNESIEQDRETFLDMLKRTSTN